MASTFVILRQEDSGSHEQGRAGHGGADGPVGTGWACLRDFSCCSARPTVTSCWIGSCLGRLTTIAMISKSFTALLVLLVLSTRADDIAAAATPDLDDDVLATQDNDYLRAVRPHRPKAPAEEDTPFSFRLNVPASSPSAASPTIAWFPHSSSSPWLSADLRSSIMSLQC